MCDRVRQLGFVVVGTPRSGTTLIQRLACELPGIGMPPETHFLGFFALDLLRRRRFPLTGVALREELETYARFDKSIELGIEPAAVQERLGGRCESLSAMFSAIVDTLIGPAELLGEKSPEHLLWWRPLARALPSLRVVAVVREPRAVVASALAVWGDRGARGAPPHLLRAERWAADTREVSRAAATLGPERCVIIRYEDVVRDADAARARLAAFLGVRHPAEVASTPSPRIVLSREWWKSRTYDPVTNERVLAWREHLAPREAKDIAAICRSGMRRLGYQGAPGKIEATERTVGFGLKANLERARFRTARLRHVERINRTRM